jgi:AcrR family transcriptional regulator
MVTPRTSTRDRIIAAASKLFYDEGVRSVSVDAVAEKAGVTKRTLYYHFSSKDELVAAYLDDRDLPNLILFKRWFDETEGDVGKKTQAIFDNLLRSAKSPRWKGCGFLRTSAELANLPGHPAVKVGMRHKKKVEAWLAEQFAADGSIREPPRLAQQIVLLMNGAFALAMLHRDPAYMESAGNAARTLIDAAQH